MTVVGDEEVVKDTRRWISYSDYLHLGYRKAILKNQLEYLGEELCL